MGRPSTRLGPTVVFCRSHEAKGRGRSPRSARDRALTGRRFGVADSPATSRVIRTQRSRLGGAYPERDGCASEVAPDSSELEAGVVDHRRVGAGGDAANAAKPSR